MSLAAKVVKGYPSPSVLPLLQARLLSVSSTPRGPSLALPLLEAQGLFLARGLTATRAVPGRDSSAMDGYAVRSEETRGATRDRPAKFRRVGDVFAGGAPNFSVGPGDAARIFTGAPVPDGADCVVRQEAAHEAAGEVRVFISAPLRQNVRVRGEEVAEGDVLLESGMRVDPGVMGIAATQGAAELTVFAAPKTSVLCVGDELLAPGVPAEPHQIFDSNGPLLCGLVREAGGELVRARRTSDDEDALTRELEAILADSEVVVTSGGASVGDRDRVKRVLTKLRVEWVFDGVALKPGKPLALARVGNRSVIVLPGNPGAAAAGFDLVARAVLLKRQGVTEVRKRVRARLAAPVRKQPALTYLVSANLHESPEGLVAQLRQSGSGQLRQNLQREGWAHLPPGVGELAAGDEVEVEIFAGSRFVAAEQT